MQRSALTAQTTAARLLHAAASKASLTVLAPTVHLADISTAAPTTQAVSEIRESEGRVEANREVEAQSARSPGRQTPEARSIRSSSSCATISSQLTVTPSTKPRTLFNQGVSTSNPAQLERQAANLREQADANIARANAIRGNQHVCVWSNDSSFKGFSDTDNNNEGEEEDEDEDEEMEE